MKKSWISAFLVAPWLTGPAWAQAPEFPSATRRVSLELGAGLGNTTPFAHARLNYRLPAFNDRVDLFLDQTFVSFTPIGALFVQTTLVGAKYYFWQQRPFAAFAGAGGGLSYGLGLGGVSPGFMAGFGGDWSFSDAFAASLGIYGTFPIGFRPELNLKLAF